MSNDKHATAKPQQNVVVKYTSNGKVVVVVQKQQPKKTLLQKIFGS